MFGLGVLHPPYTSLYSESKCSPSLLFFMACDSSSTTALNIGLSPRSNMLSCQSTESQETRRDVGLRMLSCAPYAPNHITAQATSGIMCACEILPCPQRDKHKIVCSALRLTTTLKLSPEHHRASSKRSCGLATQRCVYAGSRCGAGDCNTNTRCAREQAVICLRS
jgi:hypothetical protein